MRRLSFSSNVVLLTILACFFPLIIYQHSRPSPPPTAFAIIVASSMSSLVPLGFLVVLSLLFLRKSEELLFRLVLLSVNVLGDIVIWVYLSSTKDYLDALPCIIFSRACIYSYIILILFSEDYFNVWSKDTVSAATMLIFITMATLVFPYFVTTEVWTPIKILALVFMLISSSSTLYLYVNSFLKFWKTSFYDSLFKLFLYLSYLIFLFYVTIGLWIFSLCENYSSSSTTTTILLDYKLGETVLIVAISILAFLNDFHRAQESADGVDVQKVFVRYISHEICTPLNVVHLGLKLLQKELIDANPYSPHLKTVEEIMSSTNITLTIVNDLLTYEGLESGTLKVKCKDVEIQSFINEAVQPFLVQARHAGIDLSVKISSETIIYLKRHRLSIDKKKMHQVMRNLLSNALKFTKSGGHVTIKVSKSMIPPQAFTPNTSKSETSVTTRKILQIEVVDDGIGISKENLPRVFKERIQFDISDLRENEGAGLGLWISKGIVDLHGGRIYVYSEGEGFGATFFVDLPLYERHSQRVSEQVLKKAEKRHASPLTGVPVPNLMQRDRAVSDSSDGNHQDRIMPWDSAAESELSRDSDGGRDFDDATSQNSGNQDQQISSPASSPLHTRRYSGAPFIEGRDYKDGDEHTRNDDTTIAVFVDEMLHKKSENKPSPANSNTAKGQWTGTSKLADAAGGEDTPTRVGGSEGPTSGVTNGTQSTEKKMRILFVDDVKMSRKMVKRMMLSKIDSPIDNSDEAEDGVDAVTKLKLSMDEKRPYDAVLMDHMMPNMDGPTAAKEMRAMGYKGPIIGITGNTSKEDTQLFLSSGANKVLGKPLDFNALEAALTESFASVNRNTPSPLSFTGSTLYALGKRAMSPNSPKRRESPSALYGTAVPATPVSIGADSPKSQGSSRISEFFVQLRKNSGSKTAHEASAIIDSLRRRSTGSSPAREDRLTIEDLNNETSGRTDATVVRDSPFMASPLPSRLIPNSNSSSNGSPIDPSGNLSHAASEERRRRKSSEANLQPSGLSSVLRKNLDNLRKGSVPDVPNSVSKPNDRRIGFASPRQLDSTQKQQQQQQNNSSPQGQSNSRESFSKQYALSNNMTNYEGQGSNGSLPTSRNSPSSPAQDGKRSSWRQDSRKNGSPMLPEGYRSSPLDAQGSNKQGTTSPRQTYKYQGATSPRHEIQYPFLQGPTSPRYQGSLSPRSNDQTSPRVKRTAHIDMPSTTEIRDIFVLVVSSNDHSRRDRAQIFRNKWKYCDEARDGVEAMTRVRRSMQNNSQYDVVLMDYLLPNMDGPTTAKELRSMGYYGKIIGVLPSESQQHEDVYLKNGVQKVFIEPIDFISLVGVMEDDSIKYQHRNRKASTTTIVTEINVDFGRNESTPNRRSWDSDRAAQQFGRRVSNNFVDGKNGSISEGLSRIIRKTPDLYSADADDDDDDDELERIDTRAVRQRPSISSPRNMSPILARLGSLSPGNLVRRGSGSPVIPTLQLDDLSELGDEHLPEDSNRQKFNTGMMSPFRKSDSFAKLPSFSIFSTNTPQKKMRVLVVDNNRDRRSATVKILAARVSVIVEADSSVQAMQMVRNGSDGGASYDVVLINSIMPSMTGPTCANGLRSSGYSGTVIGMIDGGEGRESVDEFMAQGADAVLVLPIQLLEFDEAMRGDTFPSKKRLSR